MDIEAPRRRTLAATSLQEKLALLSRRSPTAIVRLLRRILAARWQLRRATQVGQYVKLDGRLRVVNYGRLIIGNHVLFHAHVATTELMVMEGAELRIGDGAFINYGAEISVRDRVTIGEECRIGTHCIIMDNDFHHVELARRDEPPPGDPIVLDPYVWVGNRVTILKGVHIGYGSVIAAGSVVTKSVPPMSIAAGVPARVLRRIDDPPGARPAPVPDQALNVLASYSDGDKTPTYPQYLPPPPPGAGVEQ